MNWATGLKEIIFIPATTVDSQLDFIQLTFLSTIRLILSFNPLIPRSDQYINSPFNVKTVSSRQVTRIKKIIN